MKETKLFMVQKILVSNLPAGPGNYDFIVSYFSKFGRLTNVRVLRGKASIEFAGFGVVLKILNARPLIYKDTELNIEPIFDDLKPVKVMFPSDKNSVIVCVEALQKSVEEVERSVNERLKENMVYQTLKRVLDVCGNATIFPFGSRTTGLANMNSDLDIFFDRNSEMYRGLCNQHHEEQERIVMTAYQLLSEDADCSDVKCIPKARVPIVTFTHVPTGIRCDVSFKNGLSSQNTRLIKFYVSVDARVKPIVLFLKDWVSKNKIHGPPLFSSYSITMLVIFYLQQLSPPILPTVEYLYKIYNRPNVFIAGWDCSFNSNLRLIGQSCNESTIIDLIKGFFEFYARFNYREYLISIRCGLSVEKKNLDMLKVRLPTVSWNKFKSTFNPNAELLWEHHPFVVLDPLEISHNLTKGFNETDLYQFVYLCESSVSILSNNDS